MQEMKQKDPKAYAEMVDKLSELGQDNEPNLGDRDTYNPETGKENTSGGLGMRGDLVFGPPGDDDLEFGDLSKVNFYDDSKFGFGKDYDDYINKQNTRFDPDNTGGGGGEGITSIIPTKTPITENVEEEVVPSRNFGGLAPRFAGSIFDFDGLADGGRAGFKDGEGIMQMASAPDPMDERNSMMETIAMEEFGKPLSDLSEDEIIQIELFMEELSKIKNEPRIMAQQSGIARAGAMDGGRMMMMANQEEEDDPEGGIMDLETSRQMYGLGKLVKKITRSVKKVAKSPVGKLALLYAGGAGLSALGAGSAGTGFGMKMFGPKAFASNLGMSLGKLGLGSKFIGPSQPKAFFGLGKAGAGILGTSLLAGLMTPKEEEENNDEYYKNNKLDMSVRYRPFETLMPAASGSRFKFAADGG